MQLSLLLKLALPFRFMVTQSVSSLIVRPRFNELFSGQRANEFTIPHKE